MTEFNQSKYNECETEFGHEYGYGDEAGVCTYCGVIHNCEAESSYEYTESPLNGFVCTTCHHDIDNDVWKEIEEANADARDAELEYRSNLL